MSDAREALDLLIDLNTMDETGLPWAFLERAADPGRIIPGSHIIVGAGKVRAVATVVDVVEGSSTSGRSVAQCRITATSSAALRRRKSAAGSTAMKKIARIPKVTGVEVRPPYGLHLTFDDGLERDIDLADEIWGPVFEPHKDPEVFAQVTIDYGTVTWPNGADLDPLVLHGDLEPATSRGDGRRAAMIEEPAVRITLPADVAQIDQTGYVWTFLDRAGEPERVVPGVLIVVGDPEDPFLARVVDIVDGPDGRQIVHIDVVGVPEQAIEELGHSRLLSS